MHTVSDQLVLLPHQSGVYRFLNKDGEIIYVGKAKDLKKRVGQYFRSSQSLPAKTVKMVSQIASIEYTVVDTESDALLLENNLIKNIQPKYNILLKDDKTYPWICVKDEPFPRVFSTRRMVRDRSLYFGPYTNGYYCKQLVSLMHTLYPLRTCNLSLTPQAIARGRYRKCLQAHIGRCKAPCVGEENAQTYEEYIHAVKSILKGDIASVRRLLQDQMAQAAAMLDFERAQKFKDQLEALTRHQKKSVIVNQQITDLDVFTLVMDSSGQAAFGNFLRVSQGAVIQSQNVRFRLRIEETPEAILSLFMAEMQAQKNGLLQEVLVPFMPEASPQGCKVHVPGKGDKKELVQLSLRNADNYRTEQIRLSETKGAEQRNRRNAERLLTQLKDDLNMKELPVHIECFDNSNLQGTNPVASCVVFRNGVPSKKDYRHFAIKTVEGPNDYASMKEVVTRRYARLLNEEADLPQLILIDGGKGQLSAAFQALEELGLESIIALAGLAKRMEEVYLPGDPVPLYLNKNSGSLKLLMHLRDEAHRFGITFHRQKRSRAFARSALSEISGVGPVTTSLLLKEFGSVKRIAGLSEEELSKVIRPSLARIILQALNDQGTGS